MSVWKAELSTVFESPRPGATVLGHRQSVGPLALQKILYPEGPLIAHAFILHPPSGIAGGDAISIAAHVMPQAHALISTPGAARWYKANGRLAEQQVRITVENDGCLEWLPSENIFFTQADARLSMHLHLAPRSRFIGWELMQFGLQSSLSSAHHDWHEARVGVHAAVSIGDGLDWREAGVFTPDNVQRSSTLQGTGGFPVQGTLWAYNASSLIDEEKDAWPLAAKFSDAVRSGFTQMPSGLVVFRVLAVETALARDALVQAWQLLRPWAVGRPATALRIWAT